MSPQNKDYSEKQLVHTEREDRARPWWGYRSMKRSRARLGARYGAAPGCTDCGSGAGDHIIIPPTPGHMSGSGLVSCMPSEPGWCPIGWPYSSYEPAVSSC